MKALILMLFSLIAVTPGETATATTEFTGNMTHTEKSADTIVGNATVDNAVVANATAAKETTIVGNATVDNAVVANATTAKETATGPRLAQKTLPRDVNNGKLFQRQMRAHVEFPDIQGFVHRRDGNCAGNTISSAGCGYCSLPECAVSCLGVPNCAGFSFIMDENRCLIKSVACVTRIPNDNVHFYEKTAEPATARPTSAPVIATDAPAPSGGNGIFVNIPGYKRWNGNCPGAVLSGATGCEACSIQRCAELCSQEAECNGFSFISDQTRCLLKAKSCEDEPFPNENTKFYSKSAESTKRLFKEVSGYKLLSGYCTNGAISECPGCTIHECKTRCDQSPFCAGFTYVLSTTSCTLLNANCDAAAIPSDSQRFYVKELGPMLSTATVTTTTVAPAPPVDGFPAIGGYNILNGNCFGSVIQDGGCTECTPEVCADKCTNLPNCVGFTYVKSRQQCVPKHAKCVPERDDADIKFYVKGSPVTEPPLPNFPPIPEYRLELLNCRASPLLGHNCPGCTIQQCALVCNGLQECKGFTYEWAASNCLPVSESCFVETHSDDIRYYRKLDDGTSGGDDLFKDIAGFARLSGNCFGGVIQELGCYDCPLDVCAERCRGAVDCEGFSYIAAERSNIGNAARCVPKSLSCDSPTPSDNIRYYKKDLRSAFLELNDDLPPRRLHQPPFVPISNSPTVPEFPPMNGYTIHGFDCRAGVLTTITCQACPIQQCATQCSQDSSCKGFTYLWQQRQCNPVSISCTFLTADDNVKFYKRIETTTQAPTTQAPAPVLQGYIDYKDQNCYGATIEGEKGECFTCTLQACAELCTRNDLCSGITYFTDEQRCMSKSASCTLATNNQGGIKFFKRIAGPPLAGSEPTTPGTGEPSKWTPPPEATTLPPGRTTVPYQPKPMPTAVLTTRQVCYNTKLDIGCPTGQRLKILQAHFGRISYPNEKSCGFINPVNSEAVEVDCGFHDVRAFIAAQCNNKANCRIQASETMLGTCQRTNSLCKLASLYLEATFICVDPEDNCAHVAGESPSGLVFAASSSARVGVMVKPASSCSSQLGPQCEPDYARLSSSSLQSWCPSDCDSKNGFLQIDLGAPYKIRGLILQGRRRWNHYVSRYTLTHSNNGIQWTTIEDGGRPKEFDGAWDARTVVLRTFGTDEFTARYIRMYVSSFVGYPAIHVDVLRCREVVGCEPLSIQNSNVTDFFGVFGQSVLVECDPRFRTSLGGLRRFTVQCLADTAQWSASEQCDAAVNCGEFPVVQHALHDGKGWQIGESLTYTCDPGFRLDGPALISCQQSGLWSLQPQCIS